MRYGSMKPSELGELSILLGSSFAFPPPEAEPWLKGAGFDNVRVVRDQGRVHGCLVQIPMGQYFGGRSVPIVGIAGVGVGIADRGRGAARSLMTSTVREIAARKIALSTLYPATQTLYRAVGYERAGKLVEVSVPTHLFKAPKTDLVQRTLGPGDERATTELYREVSASMPGYLDRGPYNWARVRTPRGQPAFGVGFFAPPSKTSGAAHGALEAYLYFVQTRPVASEPFHTVLVKDVAAKSPAGFDAVARFLGDQRSLGRTTLFRAGPSTPLLMKLAEPTYEEKSLEDWMVRVTHVSSALEARGYPRHLDAALHLDVTDPLVGENTGRFVLTLEGGRGRVKKGGRGSLRLDVRALAPLYTGYLSATQLGRLGELRAQPETVALADEVFASPAPSMAEMF